jgi:hypothetical protein
VARKKKEEQQDDFTSDLISQINKAHNDKIAFNLGTDDAPTNIKRWIGTGSQQLDFIISNQLNGGLPEGRIVEIQGPTSCHAKGDRVLLYSGETIAVENVKPGHKLMGPDGHPRTVLETHTGNNERMYKIIPKRGGKVYTVTENHILNLARAHGYSKNEYGPKSLSGERINIKVKDYLQKSKTFKKIYRQQKQAIDTFNAADKKPLPIPPYILGLLLGDGTLSEKRVELTTKDKEISDAFCSFIKSAGFSPKMHCKKHKNPMMQSEKH